jgi:hypothetical protein
MSWPVIPKNVQHAYELAYWKACREFDEEAERKSLEESIQFEESTLP